MSGGTAEEGGGGEERSGAALIARVVGNKNMAVESRQAVTRRAAGGEVSRSRCLSGAFALPSSVATARRHHAAVAAYKARALQLRSRADRL